MPRQHPPVKKLNKRGLILCEGQTEVMYFNGLKAHPDNKRKLAAVGVEIYKPQDHSPRGLVTEAKKKIADAKRDRNPFDFVWLVFDKDGHARLPDAFHEIETYKGKPEIKTAFSITCFEYFILLHFVKTTKQFRKCDDIIAEIETHHKDYKKATNTYADLLPHKETAIANCEFVKEQVKNDLDRGVKVYELHYYCDVHKLVQFLEGL